MLSTLIFLLRDQTVFVSSVKCATKSWTGVEEPDLDKKSLVPGAHAAGSGASASCGGLGGLGFAQHVGLARCIQSNTHGHEDTNAAGGVAEEAGVHFIAEAQGVA